MQDCNIQYFSHNETLYGSGVPTYFMKISLTLRENPLRTIEFTGNPSNGKLGLDLATWLNVKLAENE